MGFVLVLGGARAGKSDFAQRLAMAGLFKILQHVFKGNALLLL